MRVAASLVALCLSANIIGHGMASTESQATTTPVGTLRSSKCRSPMVSVTNSSMRWLEMNPRRVSRMLTSLRQLIAPATASMVEIGMPDANMDPTMLPPLVPETQDIGIPASTRALMTPTCVTDLAVPPLNASPMAGAFVRGFAFAGFIAPTLAPAPAGRLNR